MKHNLGKCSALMLLAWTTVLVSGIASADCRLENGTSKEGSLGPAELLPPCLEQADAARDTQTSKMKEPSQDPPAQKISIVPSQKGLQDKPR